MSLKSFPIKADGYTDHIVKLTRYLQHASGVDIRLTHDIPRKTGIQFRWLQTVVENGSFFQACRRQSYVDPFADSGARDPAGNAICRADDAKPFYWTDAEFTGGQGPFFSDRPSEGRPATGRVWINFYTSLCEVTGTDIVILITLAWGFDRFADGRVGVAAVRLASSNDQDLHVETAKKMYPRFTYSVAEPPRVFRREMDYSCTRR